jgi:hypothetical protein
MGEADERLLLTWPVSAGLGLLCIGCAVATSLLSVGVAGDGTSAVVAASLTGGFGWFFFYAWLARALYTHGGEESRMPMPLAEESRAISYVCLLHQLLVLPLLYLAATTTRARDWGAFWSGPVGGLEDMLPRHLVLCLIGFEAKDFFPPAAFGVTGVFAAHHLFVFVACGTVLASPMGLGLLITLVLVAEAGSGFYAIYCLWPERISSRLVYQLAMTASNAYSLVGGVDWFTSQSTAVHPGIRVPFLVILLVLILLRTIGQCLELKRWRDEATPRPAERTAPPEKVAGSSFSSIEVEAVGSPDDYSLLR